MILKLSNGNAITVNYVGAEIPMNGESLPPEYIESCNYNSEGQIKLLKPDSNIILRNTTKGNYDVIVDPTCIIGYITRVNKKSVYVELYDPNYVKDLNYLIIEPIILNVGDQPFVIFECYAEKLTIPTNNPDKKDATIHMPNCITGGPDNIYSVSNNATEVLYSNTTENPQITDYSKNKLPDMPNNNKLSDSENTTAKFYNEKNKL